jgi:hypothetical protein
MNNLVFNNVASQLLTQIYGQNPLGQATAIQTDANGNLITIAQPQFTESNTTIAAIGATTITVLTENTSMTKNVSYYVQNQSTTATFGVNLQIAPSDVEALYVDEPTGTFTIEPSSTQVLVVQKFLKFARLLVSAAGGTSSATIYFNAQT